MDLLRFMYSFVLFSSLICGVILIRYSFKRRKMPGANYFIAITIVIMIYNGTYMFEINSNKLSLAMLWFSIEHIPMSILPYLWIMMSLDYIRAPKKYIRIAKYIMLYHPIIMLISFYTNDINHLYISSYRFVSNGHFPVIVTEKGIMYMIFVASVTVIGLMCTGIYIFGYIKSVSRHRQGYIVMSIASMVPWFSVYLNVAQISDLGIDNVPVFSIITGFLYMYGIFQYRIFNAVPIAKEMVFRKSREAILLVDLTDTIIDVNDAFLRMYPEFDKSFKKNTLDAFIKEHTEFKGRFNENAKVNYQLIVNGQISHYSAEIIKILTEEGFEIGKMLVINDITLFIEKQNRLETIASEAIYKAEINEVSFLQAQIKPHFINNTLSVISSMITRNPDEAKELIVSLSEYLVNCYSYSTTSGLTTLEEELQIVNTYVNIEKARFRERLSFQLIYKEIIKVNIPRLALQTLIENAIQHGILKKVEGGNVSLEISSDECKVHFEICDDGVGMDEERIEYLLNGKENNQGVGIFNVNKRLMNYSGEGLKINSVIGQGTKVSFSFPLEAS